MITRSKIGIRYLTHWLPRLYPLDTACAGTRAVSGMSVCVSAAGCRLAMKIELS
jgi:hypothetical protein